MGLISEFARILRSRTKQEKLDSYLVSAAAIIAERKYRPATILHADLDAFYASVEQLLEPSAINSKQSVRRFEACRADKIGSSLRTSSLPWMVPLSRWCGLRDSR